jgi:preprotein translocase subunit SecD
MKVTNNNLKIVLIVLIAAAGIYLVLPNTTKFGIGSFALNVKTELGLDLVGGAQILLEADVPADQTVNNEAMNTARQIVENRVVGGLGSTEAVVQRVGDRRISVEIPGQQDPEKARAAVKGTGLLEFVDMSSITQNEAASLIGKKIKTDFATSSGSSVQPTQTVTSTVPVTTTVPVTSTLPVTGTLGLTDRDWHTVFTGTILKEAVATTTQTGGYEVALTFTNDGATQFSNYTADHVGTVLAIILDKTVLSVPNIQTRISEGRAVITGNFTLAEANSLAIQMRYGALPIPLKVVETRSIGPSLGEDSLTKSLLAGAVGAGIVVMFMVLYYRLPGIVAVMALTIYAVITYALYRTIPITLTLPGIAGLMLSTGSALDSNILIFERMKEELRSGKPLRTSISQGFTRAWPSIRDSNLATILVAGVLWFFGGQSGATIVIGFAFTLLVGVIVSLFTALFVTRTLLDVVLNAFEPDNKTFWFGL